MKKYYGIVLALLFALSAGAAEMRTSQYPNTPTLLSNWLFNIAVPAQTNYNISWGQLTNLLWSAMLAGNGAGISNAVVKNVKQPFFTNYTATATDNVLLAYGTNQVITLPNATTTTVGWNLTVATTNENAIVILTNATGAQTIRTYNFLSYTNSGIGSASVINSGAHWWMIGKSD